MRGRRSPAVRWLFILVATAAIDRADVRAQAGDETRVGVIAAAQAEKAKDLKPYEPNKAERIVTMLEEKFLGGQLKWHPFFESAYSGGGFTLGAGYATHVSSYNTVDVRGSITFSNYKRLEAEYLAPRLFNRRGRLSVLGPDGWPVGLAAAVEVAAVAALASWLTGRYAGAVERLLAQTRDRWGAVTARLAPRRPG